MEHNALRYEIELDVLERRPELGDGAAIALLRSELRLAVNASHFVALSADDPAFGVRSRSVPQEGVARFVLTLDFVPRRALGAAEATALVHSEFARALNASHLWRVCVEAPAITVASRERVADEPPLRWAA